MTVPTLDTKGQKGRIMSSMWQRMCTQTWVSPKSTRDRGRSVKPGWASQWVLASPKREAGRSGVFTANFEFWFYEWFSPTVKSRYTYSKMHTRTCTHRHTQGRKTSDFQSPCVGHFWIVCCFGRFSTEFLDHWKDWQPILFEGVLAWPSPPPLQPKREILKSLTWSIRLLQSRTNIMT